jgi:hypothetical protein
LALAAVADYVSDWAPDPPLALDEADQWARRAMELNNHEPASHLALGNAWAELLKVNPDFSLQQRARVLPYKDPAVFQKIIEGLAKPAWPKS